MGTFRSAAQVPQRQHNEDRLRRADSWCQRSVEAECDMDKFIFLWIAFNAAYGFELPRYGLDAQPGEREKYSGFCNEIVERDEEMRLQRILCDTFYGSVCTLLNNRFIYKPFWEGVWGRRKIRDWESRFARHNKEAQKYLDRGNVGRILEIVLERLYTLRNQIFHGGATYGTGWGKVQVRDGAAVMAAIVPAILDIMRTDIDRNPNTDVWGRVAYPRVGEERT